MLSKHNYGGRATAMDGGSVENAGAFFDPTLRFICDGPRLDLHYHRFYDRRVHELHTLTPLGAKKTFAHFVGKPE